MFTRRRDASPWGPDPQPLRARARWRLADILNRSRRVCWADLVSWALATRDEQRRERTRHPLRDVFGTDTCREDYRTTGACYCGKFREEA